MDNTEQINWGDFINYRGTTVIPCWVNKIDDQAFCGCRDLKDVEIEDGVEMPTLSMNAPNLLQFTSLLRSGALALGRLPPVTAWKESP